MPLGSAFLRFLGPGILQCNRPVENNFLCGAVFIQREVGEAMQRIHLILKAAADLTRLSDWRSFVRRG